MACLPLLFALVNRLGDAHVCRKAKALCLLTPADTTLFSQCCLYVECYACPCFLPLVIRLGDARYLSQQLPAAKALYTQALQLRLLCCGPLTCGQAGPQEQLELAASHIKVADICKVGDWCFFQSGFGLEKFVQRLQGSHKSRR